MVEAMVVGVMVGVKVAVGVVGVRGAVAEVEAMGMEMMGGRRVAAMGVEG